MCLAIPGEIIEIQDEVATVRIGEALRKASLMLIPEGAKVGDYVIVHAGFALHILDAEEARETLRLIREYAACLPEDGEESRLGSLHLSPSNTNLRSRG